MATPPVRTVVFRVAAGPRIGYGHLVRATVLARQLGGNTLVSIRGHRDAALAARRLGWRLLAGPPADVFAQVSASLLVLDDPNATAARRWCNAAAGVGVPTASVHDLGLAPCGADLAIDGSVVQPSAALPDGSLTGTRFTILRPTARRWHRPRRPSVLVALGGGPRTAAAMRLARRLRAARPDVSVRIAGGFSARRPTTMPAGVSWLGPSAGLGPALATSSVAVLGGGLTLYEACRVGVPAVGVAVVPAQRPTIRGLATRGAVLDGGRLADTSRILAQVVQLLENDAQCARMSRLGRALVDGRGAARVAAHLTRLAGRQS